MAKSRTLSEILIEADSIENSEKELDLQKLLGLATELKESKIISASQKLFGVDHIKQMAIREKQLIQLKKMLNE